MRNRKGTPPPQMGEEGGRTGRSSQRGNHNWYILYEKKYLVLKKWGKIKILIIIQVTILPSGVTIYEIFVSEL